MEETNVTNEEIVADAAVATECTSNTVTSTDPTDPTVIPAGESVAVEPVEKTLGNTDVNGASVNVPDLQVFGNGDLFQLLSKASSQSEGWMKSTKAMQVHNGCVVQVTTQQRNPDGSYSIAEALTFIPDVRIYGDAANGRYLDRV